MKTGDVAATIGKGLVAGLAGTAAITVSSTLEMKLRHRPPSEAPAKVGEKVLGVRPKNEKTKMRFAQLMHWGYGTMWGAARGLIDAARQHVAPLGDTGAELLRGRLLRLARFSLGLRILGGGSFVGIGRRRKRDRSREKEVLQFHIILAP